MILEGSNFYSLKSHGNKLRDMPITDPDDRLTSKLFKKYKKSNKTWKNLILNSLKMKKRKKIFSIIFISNFEINYFIDANCYYPTYEDHHYRRSTT